MNERQNWSQVIEAATIPISIICFTIFLCTICIVAGKERLTNKTPNPPIKTGP